MIITLNKKKGSSNILYSYSNSDCLIEVYDGGCQITTNIIKVPVEAIFVSSEFKKLVQDSLLAYLVSAGKPITCKRIAVQDDNGCMLSTLDRIAFYSLIKNPSWNPDNLTSLKSCLNEYLTTNDLKKRSCFISLLIAKSKDNESERFQYLWSAFNSYYNVLTGKENDTEGLKSVLTSLNIDEKLVLYKKKEALHKYVMQKIGLADVTDGAVINCIKANQNDRNKELCNLFSLNEFEGFFTPNLSKDYIYGYLLTVLSYYLRCNLFHGSNPTLLICSLSDERYKTLKLINLILCEFLDDKIKDIVKR